MKKIAILGIIIAMLFNLCGCATFGDGQGNIINLSTGEIEKQRFITVYEQGKFYIIADKETKVQYLVFQDKQEGGMTILVDENGKPLLYEEN